MQRYLFGNVLNNSCLKTCKILYGKHHLFKTTYIKLHPYSLQLYKVCTTSGRGYQNIAEILSYLETDEHCRLELKTSNLLNGSFGKLLKNNLKSFFDSIYSFDIMIDSYFNYLFIVCK